MNIEKLQEKLDIAKDVLQKTHEVELLKEDKLIAHKEEEVVLDIKDLRDDFIKARKTLQNIIDKGEDLLNKIEIIDIEDLKASQIQAIASLQSAIGSNTKLLLDIYKQRQEIEKNNYQNRISSSEVKLQQNNLFVGNSRELLQEIQGILNE